MFFFQNNTNNFQYNHPLFQIKLFLFFSERSCDNRTGVIQEISENDIKGVGKTP
jgi:hypothetical protein